ncbi:hypothetical protein D9M68_874950 [compost metagenome]
MLTLLDEDDVFVAFKLRHARLRGGFGAAPIHAEQFKRRMQAVDFFKGFKMPFQGVGLLDARGRHAKDWGRLLFANTNAQLSRNSTRPLENSKLHSALSSRQ